MTEKTAPNIPQSSVFDMLRLDHQVGIVTGAHAWLGYDIACALAEAGCHVIVTSRDAQRAQQTAEKIAKAYNVDTLGIAMDQRFHDQVASMAKQAHAWKGRVDVLVNNAGGGSGSGSARIHDRSPEDELNMINTNLSGVLFCCQEVSRSMVEAGRGKIINIASIAALFGRDRRMYDRSDMTGQPVDYAAAKAGVIGLTMDLAGMLTPQGVYVNSISPGGFEKPGNLPEQFARDFADRSMLGRWGRMGTDIKGAALFLASSASDYVAGHNLVVDGGFSVWR
jgi:NAD(P)-dependent dehydrogenase (short-subunit alcohol dehydrogenase family)